MSCARQALPFYPLPRPQPLSIPQPSLLSLPENSDLRMSPSSSQPKTCSRSWVCLLDKDCGQHACGLGFSHSLQRGTWHLSNPPGLPVCPEALGMKGMKRHSSLGTLIAFLHRASLLSKAVCNKADSWPWALELRGCSPMREEAGPSWS